MNNVLCFLYENHRGEVAWRKVLNPCLRYFSLGTSFYPNQAGWYLSAFDMERNDERTFKMEKIKEFKEL